MTRIFFALFYATLIVAWAVILRHQEREYLRVWWYPRRRLMWWRIWVFINIAWCAGWLLAAPFRHP